MRVPNVWRRSWLCRGRHKHDLCHTSASFTLQVAGNVEAALTIVQKRLGHKNIATTADIYGHLTKQADRNVAGGLAQLHAKAKSVGKP
jgi:integrase